MIDLRLLRSFVAVAQEGSVTRAAERLGTAQPPLTRQIATLEADLGTRLFIRAARGMRLTDAGTAMLQEATDLIERHAGMLRRIELTARGHLGRLSVGLTSSALCHPVVAGMLRLFRSTWPDVELLIVEANTRPLLRLLAGSEVDVALLRTPVEQPQGVTVEQLTAEPMVVALPLDHALANRVGGSPIALADLEGEPFVFYRTPDNPGFHAAILQACTHHGFSPLEAQVVPRMLSALNLVETGMGVSLFPASMARFAGSNVAIRALAHEPGLVAPLSLAFRHLPMGVCKRHFVSMARAQIGNRPHT